jgi:hypothetical protein
MRKILISWIYLDPSKKELKKRETELPDLEAKYIDYHSIRNELIKERSMDIQKLKGDIKN